MGGAVGAVDLAHKGVVMRCLEAQCEGGQLLVDLFVNYDCDLEGANLFERMVLALVRISQGTPDKDASAPHAQEEEALRLGVRFYDLGGHASCATFMLSYHVGSWPVCARINASPHHEGAMC